jgi:hypothetical protein
MLSSIFALIFSFFGLFFTTWSAWVFSRPLNLKDDEIEKISKSHGSPNPYAHNAINPDMKNALISDREMARRGLKFLTLGFIFQAISIFLFGLSLVE